MDQNALQQITDRLKEANNVLVTVSANPSVDQLAACIGLTLLLNHLGKHGTAVFSGAVPSTIEFLKPDDTLEKNTDSLRDFIIALDKSKADKLRYKVEDTVVKIFITPYRTSISDKDLDFSQGDFNVDVVMALGVHERTDLDKAIMDHGRILHDATVISVNNKDQGKLGAINWVDLNASSLSEMLVELVRSLTKDALDAQMATAFMTGIVAETDRFSNTKTSPRTMALASELMSAGANQQLIASKLEAAQDIPPVGEDKALSGTDEETTENEPAKEASADGSLQIAHDEVAEIPEEAAQTEDEPEEPKEAPEEESKPEPPDEEVAEPLSLPPLTPQSATPPAPDAPAGMPSRASMALDPPTMGGQLTANSVPESMQHDASTDPLSLPSVNDTPPPPQILNRPAGLSGTPIQPAGTTPLEPLAPEEPVADRVEELGDARDAVNQAIASEPSSRPLDPIQALGAQPVDLNLHNEPLIPTENATSVLPQAPLTPPTDASAAAPPTVPDLPPMTEPLPPSQPAPSAPAPLPITPAPHPDAQPFGAPPDMNGVNPNNPTVPPSILPPSQPSDATAGSNNPSAPPPVPPPLMPPTDAI